ncbi:MAG: hypothetical protein M1438_02065 [Deltaproteobacteria bacterium]|nr:hypothetical protein [Deltaproteobacteria bacterium]
MLRVLRVWLLTFVLAGCGGGMKGALPNLEEPRVLPPPKLTSARVVQDRDTGETGSPVINRIPLK